MTTTPDYRPTDILPAACPLTIICGPPGSGKTTWARAHRYETADIIIDLDEIQAAMDDYTDAKLAESITIRNALLRELSTVTSPAAWFIVGAPRHQERMHWRKTLQPSRLIVLEVSPVECCKRIDADKGHHVKKYQRKSYAHLWWERYTRDPDDEIQYNKDNQEPTA